MKVTAEMSPGQQLQTRVTKNISTGLLYVLGVWMLALIPILSRFPMVFDREIRLNEGLWVLYDL